jgi:hypothetical protein
MSELSNALGGAAPKHTISANGKTYSVGLVTQAVKIAFEKALFQKAREGCKALREDLDPDQYLSLMEKLAKAYEDGDFAMEGSRGKKAIQSPQGAVLILSLLMGCDAQEVLQALLSNESEVLTVFRVVMKESFPGVKFEETPNAPKVQPGESPQSSA